MGEAGDPFDPTDRWHLSKSVNLTHITTTLALIVALFSWGSKMDVRLSVVERAIIMQQEIDARQDLTSREVYARIERRLEQIDSKLDRVIENGGNRQYGIYSPNQGNSKKEARD